MTPAERQRRWQERNREKYLERQRERYRKRREAGLCNQCGKPAGGLTVCRSCLDARKEK